MLNNMNDLKTNNTDKISNFIQGKLWKQKIVPYEGKIVFPFFLYVDDLEINNPLGSHSKFQSIAAIYYNFPLHNNNSMLSNIFLASLVKSVDFKMFGNDKCLTNLVNEINYLEKDGITITTDDGQLKIYFILGLVLGDNLGVNSILEFSKSFSAKFFCRLCKAHKELTKVMSIENSSLLRTVDNYEIDTASLNFKESDIMHDIFEGVCHYNMCHILKYLTITVQLFTLDKLNNRKDIFNYGSLEAGNISPPILSTHIDSFRLKMSAREMWTFVHFFSLMVGDLVPEDDEVWLFYLNFLKIIDILLSYSFSESKISLLTDLIKQHHENYIYLFNDTLKPKHHLMVHYPKIIKESGPLRHFWCFRFEGKHKEFKTYARVTSSRRNVTLTLAKKFQIRFAGYIMNLNKPDIIACEKHILFNSLSFEKEILIKTGMNPADYKIYREVQFNGISYKYNLYLSKHLNGYLFKIEAIVVVKNINVLILAREILLNNYNPHYAAYEVPKNINIQEFSIHNINDFRGPPVNTTNISSGKVFIRLKEYF
ncbi:uncharacterized protein LOC126902220 [Daktulosphaira vitifoliae]|uniref:uncharacterized protein LOC126902220 n=1 Tax=Daktulosphaira vitifoliae TaxID=58002 RepID=UPI0021A9DC36|nr:uncharacterized protein LOC126902220 [Daktulosphaira vitifoliae]